MVRSISLAALVAVLVGCGGYTPPHTVTVSPQLPPDVLVAAARARDAWCAVSDETGWCPELVASGGKGQIVVRHFQGEVDAAARGAVAQAATCADDTICISPDAAANLSADDLDGVLAHEFGHLAGFSDHYARARLMRESYPTPADIPCEVDPVTVVKLCEQQGCPLL